MVSVQAYTPFLQASSSKSTKPNNQQNEPNDVVNLVQPLFDALKIETTPNQTTPKVSKKKDKGVIHEFTTDEILAQHPISSLAVPIFNPSSIKPILILTKTILQIAAKNIFMYLEVVFINLNPIEDAAQNAEQNLINKKRSMEVNENEFKLNIKQIQKSLSLIEGIVKEAKKTASKFTNHFQCVENDLLLAEFHIDLINDRILDIDDLFSNNTLCAIFCLNEIKKELEKVKDHIINVARTLIPLT